jgi:hypothetical protein
LRFVLSSSSKLLGICIFYFQETMQADDTE